MHQDNIRKNITNNLQSHIRTHQHSLVKSFARKMVVYSVVLLLIIGSIVSLILFFEQARVAQAFNPFIGASIIGYIWMWFPELILCSVLLFALSALIMQLNKLDVTLLLKLGAPAYIMISILSIVFTPITTTIAETTNFDGLSSFGYRIDTRDSYIVELEGRNEYFGAIVQTQCGDQTSEISIDHGGVIKNFRMSEVDCLDIVQENSLVWVSYKNDFITDYVIVQ